MFMPQFKLEKGFLKKYQLFIGIFAVTLLLIIFTSATPSNTQTPTPNSGSILENQIRSLAKSDVEQDISRRNDYAVKVYGKKGLNDDEILRIYDQEYTKQATAKKKDLRELLNPSNGWIAFILLLLGTIFQDTLKKWIGGFFDALVNKIYNRFAGSRFLRGAALKRYRKELKQKYEALLLPFRPNRPLNISKVYVPLKVTGNSDSALRDAKLCMAEHCRLMVKGNPGTGKSMLLRHITFCYAEGYWDGVFKKFIPVLLQLSRLSDNSEQTLEQHLVEVLKLDGFPHAEHFVTQSLKQDRLMLLLDGFDEVNSSDRKRVVKQIRDLLDQYQGCPVIITCRSAIYRDEFLSVVNQTLEVVEFNDQQIRDFLRAWEQEMPKGKSIEQLMHTLHDRPQIMTLARNPLMLTIIAYLYTDTPFILPHSRAEFYRKSTEILLDQWHQEHNQFQAREKKQILQHLALFFQDSANQQGQDRRSVDYHTVLSQVEQILPNLMFQPEDAKPLVNEIVERSGLLLAIDGGERYQFAHLTLQEFLAANKLIANPNDLIERFKADPDAWRESIKLWCGLAEDSTALICEVRKVDPLTAFECLADAQKVDPLVAEDVINSFKARLGTGSDESEIKRINEAFGAVAADSRRRSDTFKFLKETLENNEETEARFKAAANALSITNLSEAADVLAHQYADRAELRPVLHPDLIRMGDLVISKISPLVEAGSIELMDILVDIGTPLATQKLVSWLWYSDQNLASRAALLLAHLLRYSEQEKVIESYELTEDQKKVKERLDWIWKPFETSANSTSSIINGRIAYLLSRVPLEIVKSVRVLSLEPRLIIPICLIELYDQKEKLLQIQGKNLLASIKKAIEIAKEKDIGEISIERYDNEMLKLLGEQETLWNLLFMKIEPSLQILLLYQYVSSPRIVPDHWYSTIIKVENRKRIRPFLESQKMQMLLTIFVTLLMQMGLALIVYLPVFKLLRNSTIALIIVQISIVWMGYVFYKLRTPFDYSIWFLYWQCKKLIRSLLQGERNIKMMYWEWGVEERKLRGVANLGIWIDQFEAFLDEEIGEELMMAVDTQWQKIKDAV